MKRCLFLVLTLLLATPVLADWADVPLEVLVDEADLIVVGKVKEVKAGGFVTLGPQKSDHIVEQDVAVIDVASVLKTSPGIGKPKVVEVGQPVKAKSSSATILYQPGQQGIWLLRRDPGPNKVLVLKDGVLKDDSERVVFWAKHPSQLQPEKE